MALTLSQWLWNSRATNRLPPGNHWGFPPPSFLGNQAPATASAPVNLPRQLLLTFNQFRFISDSLAAGARRWEQKEKNRDGHGCAHRGVHGRGYSPAHYNMHVHKNQIAKLENICCAASSTNKRTMNRTKKYSETHRGERGVPVSWG